MRLAEFIDDNFEVILEEWEAFARTLQPAPLLQPQSYPLHQPDHAADILGAISDDIRSYQTTSMQVAKSRGDSRDSIESLQIDQASAQHASDRVAAGFELWSLIAEYRALRTNVLRLWSQLAPPSDAMHVEDLSRFNESVDQSLTEAIRHFTKQTDDDREALLACERQARLEAQAANHAKDLFLAALSHEMRTLLNATVGWTDILRRTENLDAEVVEGLDVIKLSTSDQLVLIEDLIDVTRVASGKLRLDLGECDFFQAVNGAVSIVRPAALAKDIAIDVTLAPTACVGVADFSRIQQIVWNLMSNAIKFTPRGGAISVSLIRHGAELCLVVRDSGCGIDADLLPHVFTSFRQGTLACDRHTGGLGLGLAIVKHLVELHGGTVEVQSSGINSGAKFTVHLPNIMPIEDGTDAPALVGCDEPSLSEGVDLMSASAPTPIRLDGVTVLIVDDDAAARVVQKRLLELVGAKVLTAGSGAEALAGLSLATNHGRRPDILVTGIQMPDYEELEFMLEVRRRGYDAQQLPAIAVSRDWNAATAQQMGLAGFQYHMTKPLDIGRFTAVIASLTSRLRVEHVSTSN